MSKLTPKQQRFTQEYLIDLNGFRASEVSGAFSMQPPETRYYVYLLAAPDTGKIFYVGKGTGRRAESHERAVKAGRIDNAEKYDAIRSVNRSGRSVSILYASSESESKAYALERRLIFALKDSGLANKVGGTTTEAERTRAKARHLLEMLKSRERWKAEIDEATKKTVINVYGGLDEFYDSYLNSLNELANIPDDFGEVIKAAAARKSKGAEVAHG